jgi:hypothetical protein
MLFLFIFSPFSYILFCLALHTPSQPKVANSERVSFAIPVCLSVRPRVTSWERLKGSSWHLSLGNFAKICWHFQSLVKTRQQ